MPFQIATDRPATCAPIDYRNTKNKAKFDGTTTYNVEFSPKHVDAWTRPCSSEPDRQPELRVG